jgi:hypothetical protein
VAVALVVALASAGSASGAQPQQVYGDGARFAAWEDPAGIVHVIDDRGPRFTLPVPATQPECALAGVGAGRALFDCGGIGGSASGVMVDLRSRRATSMPAFRAPSGGDASADWIAIGRSWGMVGVQGYHYAYTAYVRLDGTARHLDDGAYAPRPLRVVADLDAPGLWVHLCGGLVVPPNRGFDPDDPYSGGNVAFAYRRPLLAFARSTSPYGADVDVLLQRCGSARRTVIGKLFSGRGDAPLFGGHAVAWLDRPDVQLRSTSPTAAHTVTWHQPGAGAASLALTGRRAVAGTTNGRVLTRRLPGRRDGTRRPRG